ncbi:hypothetical protein WJX81_003431 [Elliptochloris bilobata]|uniref:Probable DNA helicase MCM8 n=1 Tax=Elliptochloris bilobata TaxID=381761 RepID=A0AAW1QUB0_9CHLO
MSLMCVHTNYTAAAEHINEGYRWVFNERRLAYIPACNEAGVAPKALALGVIGSVFGFAGKPHSWRVHFADAEFTPDDRRSLLIYDLISFFKDGCMGWHMLAPLQRHGNRLALQLDYMSLQQQCQSPDLVPALDMQPAEGLGCLGAAVYEVLFHTCHHRALENGFLLKGLQPCKVAIRLVNCPQAATHIRQLRSSSVGRLVSIRGTVVRVSGIRPLVVQMDFACGKCGATMTCAFPDGKFTPPQRCDGDGCRSRTFEPLRSTAVAVDFQKLRIQEQAGADEGDEGRVPRTLDVELREDLVDGCTAGEVVTVVGLVRVTDTSAGSKSKNAKALFLLFVDAVSVVASRLAATRASSGGAVHDMVAWHDNPTGEPGLEAPTLLDLQFVVKFTEDCAPDQLRCLVHSLCPAIYGHELVKAGLVLALLGGVRKGHAARDCVPIRGDIHVLIACCIDEFDKMASEHQALLCAMEQQEVAVAKAGLCACLPARTTVLAAANPAGGTYKRAKTVHENLKMSSAMLSRFDLTFLLLDRPDEARDHSLSEHVLALHSGQPQRPAAARSRLLGHRASQPALLTDGRGESRHSLEERLKVYTEEDQDPLPLPLLRKYIAYARTHVHPVISSEAKEVLRAFYLELRAKAPAADGAPITTRQLESLIRLCEARARADLRTVATRADAEDVVDLMKACLLDKFVDETGMLDFRRAGGKSKQAEAKRFLAALAKRCQLSGSAQVNVAQLYSLADDLELAVPDMLAFIADLNDAGELLKKGSGVYQAQCAVGSASQASQAAPRRRTQGI